MTKKAIRILALVLAMLTAVSLFGACGNGGEDDPSPSPSEEPVVYDDAPATTDFVAKVGGEEIFANVFNYFFYDALAEVDFEGLEIPEDATEEEEIELRKNYLNKEKEPGITFYQNAINEALILCQKFKISEILAKEAGFNFTDEEIKSYNESVDSTADSLLAYYGEAQGCETRDEIVYMAVGMNVNDYKRFYISQLSVSNWMDDIKADFAPTEQEMKEYYDANEDSYRAVTVRKLFLGFETEDEEGNKLPEETIKVNRQKALDTAEKYRTIIIENELDFGRFSVGFSDEVETSSQGLLDVTKYGSMDPVIINWAIGKTEGSDEIEIIEAQEGFYLIRCEGVTTYTEDSPVKLSSTLSSASIQASVLSALKEKMYEDNLEEKTKEERFAITDKNEELIKEIADKYLEEILG